jgi:NAD(P)-dependent dehydrogenase (short-subunit alcohol dehydrogenase family)
MLVVAVPEAAGPWWIHDRDSSEYRGAGVGPADRRPHRPSGDRWPAAAVPSALASLTKGGLNAVTRSLAIEYAACGVRVNTVSPGIIRTPMHAEETHDTLAALHPVGRMGDVGDIVEAIAYLETAEFVTGEILHVDGGQSAGH